MRLYENARQFNYDEIITYYPVWYRDILEMDAILRVTGKQLDEVQSKIIKAVDNNFVYFADRETLTKLESFLHITYDGPRTVSERRNVVGAFLARNGHMGGKEIKDIISAFTDGVITIQLKGGTVHIFIERNNAGHLNFFDCQRIIEQKIPAHLNLYFNDNIIQEFNTENYDAGAISEYTNEVFTE